MVDSEFTSIWAQVEAELKREGKTAADEGKTEDELKAEYHAIAERRVRLGLVLGKLGEQNGITIAADEVQRAIMARARQFPGQEQQVFQYYARIPQAQAEIRAPLFEDKVVDFIAELAKVTDKKVDKDTLFADPEDTCPIRSQVLLSQAGVVIAGGHAINLVGCHPTPSQPRIARRPMANPTRISTRTLWCRWWSNRPPGASALLTSIPAS